MPSGAIAEGSFVEDCRDQRESSAQLFFIDDVGEGGVSRAEDGFLGDASEEVN